MTHVIGSGELYDPGELRRNPDAIQTLGQLLAAATGDAGYLGDHRHIGGSHDPIAYVYEADHHCPECALARFGTDDDGWIGVDAIDGEGNPIGVVAPWDEWIQGTGEPETLACGTCGREIATHDLTTPGAWGA